MKISEGDFRFVAELLYRESGIDLPAGKEYLVNARLSPIARRMGVEVSTVIERLRENQPALIAEVVDLLTTNETSFFRDGAPFWALRDVLLPQIATASTGNLRIWSAACSSGQEAYSLAMVLHPWLDAHPFWSARIVGTDISREMVARARAGRYRQHEVERGLDRVTLARYFERSGTEWVAGDALRNVCNFQVENLLRPHLSLGEFDVIFLRNVLIYFDAATRSRAIDMVCHRLKPGGFLVLGGSESISQDSPGLGRMDIQGTTIYHGRDVVIGGNGR